MKSTLRGTLAAVLLMTTAALAQTVTKETPIFKSSVPAAVREAFKSAYPHASARSYTKVEVNGVPFYRIKSVEGNTQRKILYVPDGTVARIEERIDTTDLPAGAQQLITEKYPKAKISSADRVTEAGQVSYAVSLKQGEKMFDLQFDSEGKLTAAREVKFNFVIH